MHKTLKKEFNFANIQLPSAKSIKKEKKKVVKGLKEIFRFFFALEVCFTRRRPSFLYG